MTNKKEKIEQINKKFRSLMEPYADQLRNTGLIVEWFSEDDYPDCSSFSCGLTKNDMDEGNELIGIYLNAPEMDLNYPELYDLDNCKPEIYFSVESKIREIRDTSITKTGIKIKTKYEFNDGKAYKEKDFKLYLNGRNMLYRK